MNQSKKLRYRISSPSTSKLHSGIRLVELCSFGSQAKHGSAWKACSRSTVGAELKHTARKIGTQISIHNLASGIGLRIVDLYTSCLLLSFGNIMFPFSTKYVGGCQNPGSQIFLLIDSNFYEMKGPVFNLIQCEPVFRQGPNNMIQYVSIYLH